ncbi:MAG: hypothetical protein HC785_30415 [Calothrix sp. CSU_2_0]|nr:hypothetical protein [Calothrix sp. CSU_2_0]
MHQIAYTEQVSNWDKRDRLIVATTGNETIEQIATECEKFEFDLHEDGIYCNEVKLGSVGCTNGKWWVIQHFRL